MFADAEESQSDSQMSRTQCSTSTPSRRNDADDTCAGNWDRAGLGHMGSAGRDLLHGVVGTAARGAVL